MSKSELLKVMIVDDEEMIRRGLRAIIDWKEYGYTVCCDAADGEDGYQKALAYQPDLIITDIKMPIADGLQMMTRLKENYFESEFVLLTGYAEFEYAQKALQLGAKSYILKPIDEKELIKIISEAREEILQRRKEYFHNKYFSISMEQVITKLVYGAVDDEFIDAANAVYGFQLPWKHYQLILVEQTKGEADEMVLEKLKDFTKNNIGFVFTLNNHFVVLTRDVIFEQGKMRLLEDLNEKLRKIPNYVQPLVVSRPLREIEQINQAYYAAAYYIDHQFIFPYEEIVLIDEVGNPYEQGKTNATNQKEQMDFRKIAENLCVAVCGNDLPGITLLLENLGDRCVESGYDLEQIRIRYVSTYVSVMYLLKIQSEEIFKQEGMVDVVILQISRLSHLQSINSFFSDKLTQIAEKLNSNQQGDVIRKMKEYIEANYNSDLTLKNLSKIFHYNVAYFGKLFKSSTGMSYNDYVTSVRMEKAKELLNQGEKVYRVANQVGYQDLDYFNMKFKKYFNALPSNFHKENNK